MTTRTLWQGPETFWGWAAVGGPQTDRGPLQKIVWVPPSGLRIVYVAALRLTELASSGLRDRAS